jgi:glycosyltransferase involved in cell wall biosynthesis
MRTIRLAHIFSSDLGINASLPYIEPLIARGWEITCISPDGPHVTLALERGLRWLPLDLKRSMDPRGDLAGSLRLLTHLRDGRFDIVHTHNIKAGLIGRVLAGLVGVPIIVHTLHGLVYSLDSPPIERLLHASLERFASRHVDAILSQSEEDGATIVGTRVVGPDRLVVIGNGIDIERFDPSRVPAHRRCEIRAALGVGDDELLFLTAARLVREKGIEDLIAAALIARRRDPRVRVALAGSRDDERGDAIRSEVLERAREGGVLLLGARDDMPELYASADVVVAPSRARGEGLPRVLMEAAAMGKPLVATDVRGCREIVRPPRNGLLAPPQDPLALADVLCRMAEQPDELRALLGRQNAEEARRRYSVREAAARVVEVYDDLLVRKALGLTVGAGPWHRASS